MTKSSAYPIHIRPDHPTGATLTDSNVQTYKRTYGEITYDSYKSSRSLTHTRVQDFCKLADRTATASRRRVTL